MFYPPSLLQQTHRPFAMPTGPWIMAQRWSHLLFANYAYPAHVVQSLLPDAFEVEIFNNQAWLSVVPFELAFAFRGLHKTPFHIQFNELNLRTYVRYKGVSAVYFFCLDATDRLSVEAARTLFHLPYHKASSQSRITKSESGIKAISYTSDRQDSRGNPAHFEAQYYPLNNLIAEAEKPLAHWLTERYCFLTTAKNGDVYRGDIHHNVWPLQPAKADIQPNELLAAHGFSPPAQDGVFYYSDSIEVVNWPIIKLA